MTLPEAPLEHLPPLRKRVFRHSLVIVALFVIVGFFMLAAVFLASGMTPKLIHVNYDSISAARQMSEAWGALRHPEDYPGAAADAWRKQFDVAIAFEESNVTEPGEGKIARDIRQLWGSLRADPAKASPEDDRRLRGALGDLVKVNETGMFRLAADASDLSRHVFIGSVLLFLASLAFVLYLADGLALKIVTPLRELAETLRRRPVPGSKLKLPRPTSLEMRILTHEMRRLWERLSELQKLNVDQLHAQGKKLEAVLASVDDAILVLDNQDRVVHCNEGMLRLIGLSLGGVLGQPWNDLSTAGPNYLRLRELLNPQITSEKTVELAANGKPRVFSGRCRAFFGEGGQQIGLLYLLHDITEIRQRDRLKTEFIGVLSHELKTPLQSLGTASELLAARRESLDADGRMLVDTIVEDIGRIRAVANEFVQVGLIDLHSLKLRIEKAPLTHLVPQWIQPFQVLARDRGVKLEYLKEGSDSICTKIDTIKFPWAISNLLSNAIRVSPPGSSVTVYLSDREGRADIEVRDEGPGIPEEVQKRMFDPYYQGQQDGGRSTGFLGLGLTITKEVVEAHDGMIEYFPRMPKGTIFRISLPLVI